MILYFEVGIELNDKDLEKELDHRLDSLKQEYKEKITWRPGWEPEMQELRSEIEETIRMLESEGCDEAILLHCVSCYPPSPEDTNLRNITTFQNAFDLPVGYSDHSTGTTPVMLAVAAGATAIEKHFTFDESRTGYDHSISYGILEFRDMVKTI